jgi:hypothetical protein
VEGFDPEHPVLNQAGQGGRGDQTDGGCHLLECNTITVYTEKLTPPPKYLNSSVRGWTSFKVTRFSRQHQLQSFLA